VDEKFTFFPPYRVGLILHILLIVLLIVAGFWSLWQATNAAIGPVFLLYLLPGCVALVGVPILGYRAYALWRASYQVERGGIRLRWGLREEDIPMEAIQWVRPAKEMDPSLPLPLLRWPGSVLGTKRMADGTEIEYLAARDREFVVIGSTKRVYAISPSESGDFIQTFNRMEAFGTVASILPRSAYPSFLLARVWAARPARALLLTGLILAVLLLVAVSLAIPSRQFVSLGYAVSGSESEGVPAVQLLLLPAISGFFFLAQVLLGMYFFRREGEIVLAYLLWGSCVVTGVLFLGALFFVLNAG
jgi:hypothetical protein